MAQKSIVRDGRKPGWFYLDNELIDHYGANISALGIAVYAALARYANRDTGQAFPAYKTLQECLGLSRNTVIAAIRRLETAGLITIEQQTDAAGNPIKTNIYTLCTIAEHKRESPRKGGSENEPGGVQKMNPGVQHLNGGGSSAAYEQDSMIKTHDGDGDGRTLAFLIDQGIGAAQEFANLPYEPMRLDFNNRTAAGQSVPIIVKAWRRNPPTEAYHYEQQPRPVQSSAAPDRPARRAKGVHNGSGGADLKDPGWREREIARIQREYGIADEDV